MEQSVSSASSVSPVLENASTRTDEPQLDEPPLPLSGDDLTVPLVTGGRIPYVNLDYAASAPCLRAVAAQVQTLLPYSASVHRGAGYASQVCTALFESARGDVRRFVGGRADDVVVFTRNTTDAVNLLAHCLDHLRTGRPGAQPLPRARREAGVVVLDIEHHANLLPWQRRPGFRCLPAAPSAAATLAALDAELRAHPAALVAVTGASNVTGEVPPIAEIAALAHRRGARLFVDAAQLAPHRRIDMAADGIDYLAFSGHKLYAPFGAGALVGRPDWLDGAPAYLAGGGAVREVTTAGADWADGPARHEAGTPNLPGVVALGAACRELAALPADRLRRHEERLRDQLLDGLAELGTARVHRIWTDVTDTVGVVTFSLAGHDPGLVSAYLAAEHGIGVRAGRFCAHPLLARLGAPEGAVRASLGVGSTSADVHRLVAALIDYRRSGPRWSYARQDGQWVPTPDPRGLPDWVEEIVGARSLPAGTGSACGH